jgi:glycosyltransferase involved in cell wall biosynthesis
VKPHLDLLYLLVDAGLTLDNSPVFQSQVLDRILIQREAGIKVGVVTTVDDPVRFAEVVEVPLRRWGVEIHILPDKGLFQNLLSAGRAQRAVCRKADVSHIYVRGIWGSFAYRIAFPFGGPALIYDVRGDVVAESTARGASLMRRTLLKLLCRASFANASRLLTVSKASASMLAKEYGRPGAVVFPSAIDARSFAFAAANRVEVRSSLDIADSEILLIYAGGLSSYQMIPEMLALWRALYELPGVRFLLLTSKQPVSGPARTLEFIDQIPGLIHRSVPRSEVPSYLAAADIGFLLREEHPLNAVASPVKFGEYLGAGLAVVSSPGLGDISTLIEDRKLGVLVRPRDTRDAAAACRDLIDRVRDDREGFRARARRALHEEKWEWRSHVEMWKSLLLDTRRRKGSGTAGPEK